MFNAAEILPIYPLVEYLSIGKKYPVFNLIL
jgi:hypothetical protein